MSWRTSVVVKQIQYNQWTYFPMIGKHNVFSFLYNKFFEVLSLPMTSTISETLSAKQSSKSNKWNIYNVGLKDR